MAIPLSNIRNFSIIAHIDHGKSTLADRFIQICGGLSDREMKEQVLDAMELERERGITIKAQSVSLRYTLDGEEYLLNFIDTPGHVDFSYEVSRSLAAVEGALLVVDAAQGVEAQTVAVCYTAIEQDLTILPVFNKIDLPQADVEKVGAEVEDIIGLPVGGALGISAKTGVGVEDLLKSLIQEIPAPKGDRDKPLQALIVDSWFDSYLGVVSLIRVIEGTVKKGDQILVMSTDKKFSVDQVGVFTPKKNPTDGLHAGEVGYLIAGIKDIEGAPVGDTITLAKGPAETALPGFQRVKPQVYAGMFPINTDDYEDFKDALTKLRLNDASLEYEPETSDALGFGYRCGFLGMLHMEIIQERLEREYNLDLITTAPTVIYEVESTKGDVLHIDNPSKLPAPNNIGVIREPVAMVNILVPQDFVGKVMTLCTERRGRQHKMLYSGNQVQISYFIPMSEIVMDFFDKLKSITKGFASLDYHFHEFEPASLVKLDILINGEKVDALAVIVHRDKSQSRGREVTERLKEIVPRQMFDVAIQAAIGNQIIARTTVKALRKNVTAKCYGGDVSRKRKLLEKQKKGKKRMKKVGRVEIPQEAFLSVLKSDNS